MKLCSSRTLHKSLRLSQTNQVLCISGMRICVGRLLIVSAMQFDHLHCICIYTQRIQCKWPWPYFLGNPFNSARFIVVATKHSYFAVLKWTKYWQTRHRDGGNFGSFWLQSEIRIRCIRFTWAAEFHVCQWFCDVIHITVILLKSTCFFAAICKGISKYWHKSFATTLPQNTDR